MVPGALRFGKGFAKISGLNPLPLQGFRWLSRLNIGKALPSDEASNAAKIIGMASITFRSADTWSRVPCLAGARVVLNADGVAASIPVVSGAGCHSLPYVLGVAAPGAGVMHWLLAIPAGCMVKINGQIPSIPQPRLADRDEIRLGSHRFYFVQRDPARVVPFSSDAAACHCPRCDSKIDPGSPVVVCPGCSTVYHQSEMFPCWTYGSCTVCHTPGSLSDTTWSPADL